MSQRLSVMFCLLVLLPSSSGAAARQAEQGRPRTAPARRPGAREVAAMPVVYSVPGMDRVAVRRDLKYTRAAEPQLLMDVYTPRSRGRGEGRPAVVFIHGGVPPGSRAKEMAVFKSWGRLAAASGMVGVTFTHRLGPTAPRLSDAAADVAAAVGHVRANAAALGVDKDRLCLVAFSAGGPLLSAAMRERPAYVRCLVAFYAYLDVRHSESHRAHETAEALERFSPVAQLADNSAGLAPLYVARAGLDEVPGMNDSIDRFTREALAANAAVTVVNHPRGVHAFDIFTDDDRSWEIIRGALAFMQTHLGVAASR
ncbi:MAG TPA: alpha/beta hydrolase [Pyrinomonadaceae bacterium]